MADGKDEGSLAPRRRLSGPILPPPPPELAENERKAEAKRAAAKRDDAEKNAARQVLAAQKAHSEEQARASAESRAQEKNREKNQAKTQAKTQARSQAKAEGKSQAKAEKGTGPQVGKTKGSAAASLSPQDRSPGSQARSEQAAPTPKRGGPRRTRRAQLRLVQIDAWSVMKTSFLLSIALGIVLVVAVSIIWSVLGAAGVWESINSIVQQAVGSSSGKPFDIQEYAGTSRVMGLTMIVAVLDVILITAIATLGAFLYNLSAALLGGIEVTLAEDG